MKRLRTKDVIENMSQEERALLSEYPSETVDKQQHLAVASFLSVRRVTCQVVGEQLYLFCDCYMDNRCGTICCHKFHIYDKYY